jgi:hypothetical protein
VSFMQCFLWNPGAGKPNVKNAAAGRVISSSADHEHLTKEFVMLLSHSSGYSHIVKGNVSILGLKIKLKHFTQLNIA